MNSWKQTVAIKIIAPGFSILSFPGTSSVYIQLNIFRPASMQSFLARTGFAPPNVSFGPTPKSKTGKPHLFGDFQTQSSASLSSSVRFLPANPAYPVATGKAAILPKIVPNNRVSPFSISRS
jgi:hypothetical protein